MTNIKLIFADTGEVIEAIHPIDLIVGIAQNGGVNLLWEVEIISAKIFGSYMTFVINADIDQRNGDPDFDKKLW